MSTENKSIVLNADELRARFLADNIIVDPFKHFNDYSVWKSKYIKDSGKSDMILYTNVYYCWSSNQANEFAEKQSLKFDNEKGKFYIIVGAEMPKDLPNDTIAYTILTKYYENMQEIIKQIEEIIQNNDEWNFYNAQGLHLIKKCVKYYLNTKEEKRDKGDRSSCLYEINFDPDNFYCDTRNNPVPEDKLDQITKSRGYEYVGHYKLEINYKRIYKFYFKCSLN
jgi:hypothetical protein